MNRTTLSTRKYKAGYEIRTEKVEYEECDPVIMKVAYTQEGHYIGDSKWAYRLCHTQGIVPELIAPDHNVCSIGFCEREQKWYGWSHRAIYGFGIGSMCKAGDCGYKPDNVQELAEKHVGWNDSVEIVDDHTIRVCNVFVCVPGLSSADCQDTTECYLVSVGRGEWTAQTLDEARQMAIDFANGVA